MASGEWSKDFLAFFDESRLVSTDAVRSALRDSCDEWTTEDNVKPLLGSLVSQALSDTRPVLELLLSGEPPIDNPLTILS